MTMNMRTRKESTFAELVLVVSNWYDEHVPINMLKVLFRDHIDNTYSLHISSKTIDLMDTLRTCGSWSQADLTLLYDTIKATKQFGLEHDIKNKMPSFQIDKNIRDKEITVFTLHRQRLVKLGMSLTPSDVQKICDLYKVKHTDSWSLIMDLEHNMVFCEENMDTFIDKLKTHNLHQAVKSLTEDIPKPSSNPGQASDIPNPSSNPGLACDVKLTLMRKKEDDQPHSEYVLDLSEELDECKVILTLKENPKDFVRSIVSYYADHGLDLKEIVEESVVFHLSTHDPDSLMHLWELHSSGILIENLAEILVPEIHQQEFLDEWMTYIDENEYEAALSKLKEEEIMETLQLFTEENWNAGWLILMIMTISSLIYLYQETVTIEFMLITTFALYNLRGEERGFNIFVLFVIIFIYSTYFKFFFVADNPYNYYYKKFIEFILITAVIGFIHALRISLLSLITSKIAKYICNCTIVIISLELIYHFSFTVFYVKLWLIYFLDICYTTYILDIVVGIDE